MAATHGQLNWSARLTLSSSSVRSQNLPGDKLLLPVSVLEQLLAASTQTYTSDGDHTLDHNDPLPPSTQHLPHPLTFRLVNPANARIVYAGVQEFSAADNEIVLSPFLSNALGIDVKDDHTTKHDLPQITINARQLPRGRYVKLRPLEAGYDPEDWKALLEQHLRSNFTTLTRGEVLVIPGRPDFGNNGGDFKFLIDLLKPEAEAICIVDTDLEVDIEPLSQDQARETLDKIIAKSQTVAPTTAGHSSGGDIDIHHDVNGRILPSRYVDYQLPSWPRSQTLKITLSSHDEEQVLDLFVNPFSAQQRVRPRMTDFVYADVTGRRSKTIEISPTNIELQTAEALWVSVFCFNDDSSEVAPDHMASFSLRASVVVDNVNTAIDKTSQPEPEQHANETQCQNCQVWVPTSTFFLHESFCKRNNVPCPRGCGQVFQKNSESYAKHWHCPHDTFHGDSKSSHRQHDYIFHPPEPYRCGRCTTKESFASIPLLAQHHVTTCPAKTILCRFCHLVVPQEGEPDEPNVEALISGLSQHELIDGSRTTECHLCQRITRLRDLDTHMKHHDLERKSRPRPRLCRNENCGRTLDGPKHEASSALNAPLQKVQDTKLIGLCSMCYGPLYVSLYDPQSKALVRRIERRYLQQLVSGCGKEWCRNPLCKTGRSHGAELFDVSLPTLDTTITTKNALPLIKPFVDAEMLLNGHECSGVYFCVDSSSQRNRDLSSLLGAEMEAHLGVAKGYDIAWCVAAVEAENGNADAAKTWLSNWAPRRDEERI